MSWKSMKKGTLTWGMTTDEHVWKAKRERNEKKVKVKGKNEKG